MIDLGDGIASGGGPGGVDKFGGGQRRPTRDMHSGSELERVYDEHAQVLVAFLLNLTRPEADARDVL